MTATDQNICASDKHPSIRPDRHLRAEILYSLRRDFEADLSRKDVTLKANNKKTIRNRHLFLQEESTKIGKAFY